MWLTCGSLRWVNWNSSNVTSMNSLTPTAGGRRGRGESERRRRKGRGEKDGGGEGERRERGRRRRGKGRECKERERKWETEEEKERVEGGSERQRRRKEEGGGGESLFHLLQRECLALATYRSRSGAVSWTSQCSSGCLWRSPVAFHTLPHWHTPSCTVSTCESGGEREEE